MREIKFRAWGIDTFPIKKEKVMAFFTLKDVIEDADRCFITGYRHDDLIIMDYDNAEIMQFTGLLDKNGKEIYENDVVRVDWNDERYSPHNVQVIWNEEDLCWEIEGGCLTKDNHHFEIIGNIYENESLLIKEIDK